MENEVRINHKVSNFFLFFIIISSQIGVGLLSFQNLIAKQAKQDGWIVVFITGLTLHLVLWMIFNILDGDTKNIYSFHESIFGNLLARFCMLLLICYFFLIAVVVFQSYIYIIQVWLFPTISIWELGICILLILYYVVSGGFRVVTGVCFLAFFTPLLLLVFSLLFPMKISTFQNMFPVFHLSLEDFFTSFKGTTSIYMGFESLLIYYPFLKKGNIAKKWANLGLLYTTLLYTIVAVISISYFSLEQLLHTKWPTLEMVKIIKLPFIERFEYIFVFCWLIVIIPTICLPLWSICRLNKSVFNFRPRITLTISLVAMLVISILLNTPIEMDLLRRGVSNIGFYFIYAYIPALFSIKWLRKLLHISQKRK